MNTLINCLIQFALDHEMLKDDDKDYAVNLLLDLFKLDQFEWEEIKEKTETATPFLEAMLRYAVDKEIIEDSQTQKDLFDGRIMNCVMPRPSEVIERFNEDYMISPMQATNHYYALSIASNYIRKSRTDKNIHWKSETKYGDIEISINLSKPEKDPKDIAKAKLVPSSNYPLCLLCKENVGFAGDLKRDGRLTHRIIPVKLNHQNYYLQYSPYVYYNEHCIVFNEKHVPMQISKQTFENLLGFIKKFPHYMLGSNADLPIVGGSILSHDHYQGGNYHFPIQDAKVIQTFHFEKYPHLKIELLYWPLTTIRVTSLNQDEIVAFSEAMLTSWKNYSNEALDIIAYSKDVRHNTITPIARRCGEEYQMDLVLRNNRTNEIYPDGIFHPHKEHHHIKKENIGLIEVMGLAILPARLKDELALLEKALLKEIRFEDEVCLQKHAEWYQSLLEKNIEKTKIDETLCQEVADIFTSVLENAGVFKLEEKSAVRAVCEFVKQVGGQ